MTSPILSPPALALFLAALGACTPTPIEAPAPGVPDPAALYCLKQGGDLVMEGAVGFCHLPDGTMIEVWEYFRANNP